MATHERFRLLASGSRTAPARQQTLEATLDWSYALLTPAEATVLQHLAVFAGGWTLEATEAICTEPDAFSLLSSLVDKSLVRVEGAAGSSRYQLLETIRQYALAKLTAAGADSRVRDRQRDYYLAWAEAAEPNLIGPDQLAWVQRFEQEHDNLRAALEWSLRDRAQPEPALRLAAACGRFWRLHGYTREGRARLAAALATPEAQATHGAPRGWALNWAAQLAYLQTDLDAARAYAEESRALFSALSPVGRDGYAESINRLAQVASEIGDYVLAPQLMAEALAIWRALGDSYGIGQGLMQLGWAAMRVGDYALAVARLEEALAVLRKGGHLMYVAQSLSGLGEAAIRLGEYQRAAALLEESLALRRALGEKWGLATALGSLGWAALRQGDYPRTRLLLGESLAARHEGGDRGGLAWCLEKLAEAALLEAQAASDVSAANAGYRRAARTFAAAAELRAPIGSVIDPADQPDHERLLAALRAALGEAAFALAWAAGQSLSLDQALSDALAAN